MCTGAIKNNDEQSFLQPQRRKTGRRKEYHEIPWNDINFLCAEAPVMLQRKTPEKRIDRVNEFGITMTCMGCQRERDSVDPQSAPNAVS